MLTMEKTYTDYNGVERTETLHFNLSKAELMEMELGTSGGLGDMIQKIIAAQDAPAIMKLFKELILKAYGEKTPDGRRLMKSEAISEAFSQTPMYSDLFMELATDAEAASKFVNGIIPADAAEQIKNADPALLKRL